MFVREDFQKAVDDAIAINLNGYQFVSETEGIKIYRRIKEGSGGLYEYKAFGILKVKNIYFFSFLFFVFVSLIFFLALPILEPHDKIWYYYRYIAFCR